MKVEFRYINIKWLSRGVPSRIEKSETVNVLEINDSKGVVEVQAFKRLHGTIALRLLDKNIRQSPYFLLGRGESKPLLPVKDPETNDVWWIDDGEWDASQKRVLSEIYRTVGQVDLVVSNQTVKIRISSINFSEEKLNALFEDFKNGLWGLIVNDASPVKGEVHGAGKVKLFTDGFMENLSDYVGFLEKLMSKPKVEIKEIEIESPIHSAKPIVSSFRKLAGRGYSRNIPSKGYSESLDNPENRFVHYTVKVIHSYLSAAIRHAKAQTELFNDMAVYSRDMISKLEKKNTKVINKKVYDKELESLSLMVEAYEESRLKAIKMSVFESGNTRQWNAAPVSTGTLRVRLGGEFGKSGFHFFLKEVNSQSVLDFVKGVLEKYEGQSFDFGLSKPHATISFPDDLFSFIRDNKINQSNALVIVGCDFNQIVNKAKARIELNVFKVKSLEVAHLRLLSAYNSKLKYREALVANNWVAPLSSKDRLEIRSEINRIRAKLKNYDSGCSAIEKFIEPAEYCHKKICSQLTLFSKKMVLVSQLDPNSMVFINDPNYYNAKRLYRDIVKAFDVDNGVLESLIDLQKKGLMQVSYIYEKWCLLQIIKLFVDVYQYRVDGDWKRKLLDSIGPKFGRTDFSLRLISPRNHEVVVLDYEKSLSSGKIPDFRLTLFKSNWLNEEKDKPEPQFSVVFDAKFRDELDEYGLQNILDQLVDNKDYSESSKNHVFIFHPSDGAIRIRTSPLVWGRSSNYGQLDNHRSGYIYMVPSGIKLNSTDNLQRVLGFLFQKSFRFVVDNVNKDAVKHDAFCISCGAFEESEINVSHYRTEGGQDKYTVSCRSCNQRSYFTQCFSCGTRIFKNGVYWTCHRTKSEEVYNVICPNCETFFD